MKRWILRISAASAFLIAVVLLVVWLGLRASLPTLDGTIETAELDAVATIERDAAGIPTITAATRTDLAFATGFAHGQDRFFQMDLTRRQAAGELSELIGSALLDSDKYLRFHRFRYRAREAMALLTLDDQEILNRYAAGVNAGRDSLGSKPFEYFVLSAEPSDWQPEDSVLVVYAMFMQLNDSRARKDVQRGLVHRILPPDVYAWMYPDGSPWDAPLMGDERSVLPIPSADVYDVRGVKDQPPPASEEGKPPLNGSNNWAVSGALTHTGRAMVSNDMHLGLSVPNTFYQARLVVTGDASRDVTGVSLPGTPFIVAGSNGRVAWGYTNSYGDWTDAVLLRPGITPDTYRTPDGDRPFERHVEIINIKGEEAIEFSVRETIWGPVLDDFDYPDGEIAVSWIAHKPDGVNLRLIGLETVTSVAAAIEVANTIAMPPQNFVVGDAEGNIGWSIAGKIPVKTNFNAMLPADWSEEQGWNGWLAPEDYPRIINPEHGRIWSANARVVDAEALRIIGDGGYDLGARAKQIRDGLFARDKFAPADMLAIQYDDRALFLDRWRLLLMDVLDSDAVADDAGLMEYRRLVEDWNPRAAPESVGYRLVRAFRLDLQSKVFHALTGSAREEYGVDVRLRLSNQFEAPLWSLVTEQPIHLLPARFGSWDEMMVASVQDSIRYFAENYSDPLENRSWGERNTARIQHPLSLGIPQLSGFLDMPKEPLNGDSDLPKAQSPDFGASERFSVSPGDEENALMQMPTGQSGHPLSDFYRSGHDDWVQGRPSPFLPGVTEHTLTLTPAE
jgi:penicillin amidase